MAYPAPGGLAFLLTHLYLELCYLLRAQNMWVAPSGRLMSMQMSGCTSRGLTSPCKIAWQSGALGVPRTFLRGGRGWGARLKRAQGDPAGFFMSVGTPWYGFLAHTSSKKGSSPGCVQSIKAVL